MITPDLEEFALALKQWFIDKALTDGDWYSDHCRYEPTRLGGFEGSIDCLELAKWINNHRSKDGAEE